MNHPSGISELVINRLPRYYRFLGEIMGEGNARISSRELSERMGLTASQIRQDLNCFGGFGQQGYGYNIEQLHNEIGKILGLDQPKKAILIGAGNLGRAIATHMTFESRGFRLIGIFDKKESLKGQIIKGLPVRSVEDLDDFCRENLPTCALLCIPKGEAEEICATLIARGVEGFWNFSHCDLTLKFPGIVVENVHLGDSLAKLSYNIKNK
jgi:redox-sensing transcriptional repressor